MWEKKDKDLNGFLVAKNGNETMWVSNVEKKRLNYVLIKIGDKFYSTNFGLPSNCKITIADTNTINLGKEKCMRITGILTETNNHVKLKDPEKFEVTLYFEND